MRTLVVLGALALPLRAEAQKVNELQVTPETMTLTVGQHLPIFATAYDRQGNLIASARFVFWSSDTSVARVSREGTVVGVSAGLAKVEARIQGKRASLAVLINGGAAPTTGPATDGLSIGVAPTSAVLMPGEQVRLVARLVRADSTPVPTGGISWQSLKTEVARVDSTGLVTGATSGKTVVQATTPAGLSTTAQIEVAADEIALAGATPVLGPEEAETLRVQVPGQGNRPVSTGIDWRTGDAAIATVDSAGIVRARGPGQTEIIAVGFGQERRARLRVHKLPEHLLVSPKPSPDPIVLVLGASRPFTVAAQAADSSPIPLVRIRWMVSDTTRLGFDPVTGTAVARDTGTVDLTATLSGFDPVAWQIQVVPGTLALTPGRLALPPGGRGVLAAQLRDSAGKPIDTVPPVRWQSDSPAVATVSGGEVRGIRSGRATISATPPWGQPAAATVYVVGDLLVASRRGGSPGLYQTTLNAPDTLLPVLADSLGASQGVRSPDRTAIVFSGTRGGGTDLYIADADGANARRLTSDIGVEGEPVWMPDGTRVVYTWTPRGGVSQVVSVGADGTDPRRLAASPGGNTQPDVSPDGQRLVFVSSRDGNPELYEAAIGGTEVRRLTRSSDRERSPRYLPNGDLLYLVDKGRHTRLMVLPSGGGDPQHLFDIDRAVASIAVSRDGSRIVYASRPGLFIQSLEPGSAPVVVPNLPGEQIMGASF